MSMQNNLTTFAGAALATAVTVHSAAARADDIDLFHYNAVTAGQPPNVLFMIDNSANWNQNISGPDIEKWKMIHNALNIVFNDDELDSTMNVGLEVFAHSNSPKGGKIMEHVRELTPEYRTELLERFPYNPTEKGLPQANNAPYALSLHEAYLYFRGDLAHAGLADGDHDPDAVSGEAYISPSTGVCRNFALYVASGDPDSGEDRSAEEQLSDLGGILAGDPISLSPSNFESNWADEYARFLNSVDVVPDEIQEGEQKLVTYVIDVYDPDSNQAGNRKFDAARQYLKSIASQGGGTYYAAHNEEDIVTALTDVLTEIIAVNTVFASTTLPVSVNVRGTNLNQVYIGVFRPDDKDRPRWQGNLKLYQLNVNEGTDDVFLADVDGNVAQSATTGFIRPSATSFWTHDSNFWAFSPSGEPPSASDAPDGAVVEKGGVAQQIRDMDDNTAFSPKRTVYTCTGSCDSATNGTPTALSSFTPDNTDIDASALGVASESDADTLIRWVRGEDNAVDGSGDDVDEDNDGRTDDVRASVHGDVLHSKPAIVNYGTDGSDDVFVFYGSNDGMIHAARGGKDQATGGEEIWGFVPPEFFGNLHKLRDNEVPLSGRGKVYFADGSLASYVVDNNGDRTVDPDEDAVYLYASMRRGGRFMYALDVTDPTDPKLLWRIDKDTPGFAELGQTWSEPRVGKIAGYDDPIVFFGAGYDPLAEDHDGAPDVPGTDDSENTTEGRGLFAVNGRTGAPIWQAGPAPDGEGGGTIETVADMRYSMPAPPTVIDRDSDGDLDRVYIPDTGGQVWRVNLIDDESDVSDPTAWEVYKLASVGSDQEFQHAVDVVAFQGNKVEPAYDAVLLGSGDRENPFDKTVTNRFYMLKDRSNSSDTILFDELYEATENAIQDGLDEETRQAAIDALGESSGWYITLENPGEKVIGNSTTLAGTTFFNTNEPPNADLPCVASLGIARNYAVSFSNATATTEQDGQAGLTRSDRSKTIPGGGFPPSPVPVVVNIDGKQYAAICSGTQCQGQPLDLGVRQRVFWYREDLDE